MASIDISELVSLEKDLQKFLKEKNKAVFKALVAGSYIVRNHAKLQIIGGNSRSGGMRSDGQHGGGYRDGGTFNREYPKSITGRLANSINVAIQRHGDDATVNIGSDVDYAEYLEDDEKYRYHARPFLKKAYHDKRKRIAQLINKALEE